MTAPALFGNGIGTGEMLDISHALTQYLDSSRSLTADAESMADIAIAMYGMTTSKETRALMSGSPGLAELLVVAHRHLVTSFEHGAQFTAGVFRDPEDPSPRPILLVTVHTVLRPEEAVSSLSRFDDWYLQNPASLTDHVAFTVAVY